MPTFSPSSSGQRPPPSLAPPPPGRLAAPALARIVDLTRTLETLAHGRKAAAVKACADDLNMSVQSLYRHLRALKGGHRARKVRTDAGVSALSFEEARVIAQTLIAATRRNDKRLYSIRDAVQVLRANDKIRAERIDRKTGEITPLSESAIARALRSYGLHPDQLGAPRPVTELASRHPNHVWQIDASLCVLYYLKSGGGLSVMEANRFYKNKPRNLDRVADQRVWSYEITDHYSGWIYVQYVLGAENTLNFCDCLIAAMQDRTGGRGGPDILHGVPEILMMDPGAAGKAAPAANLCAELGVRTLIHAPGAARATGQVENARNIIERKFEAGLAFQAVESLDHLNALAATWRSHFNATALHSRHGRTRSSVWMEISPDQLVLAPEPALCRELAVTNAENRKVTPKLRINFKGSEFDVSRVPGVSVGDTLAVVRSPWSDDQARIVSVGEDGRRVHHAVDKVRKDAAGFALTATVIGEGFGRQPLTPAEANRRTVERGLYERADEERPDGARPDGARPYNSRPDGSRPEPARPKARVLAFGGALDPYRHITEALSGSAAPPSSDHLSSRTKQKHEQKQKPFPKPGNAIVPAFIPKRGRMHALSAVALHAAPLTHVEAAKLLRARLGDWSADHMARLKRDFPEGVPAADIEAVVASFTGRAAKPATATPPPLLRDAG